jgi:hypothetical protein
VAHEDITALVLAKQERDRSRRSLQDARREHARRIEDAREELGQRLTGIALAATALERGGDPANAIALIQMAVEEARHELQLLRYQDAD